jgi:hypothetical protein
MSGHTPGPWKLTEETTIGRPCITGRIGLIAMLAVHDVGDAEWDADTANARLIAAAPDLLAACEAVLSNLDHLSDVWGQEGVTRTVQDRLRAAIAKAKGGES